MSSSAQVKGSLVLHLREFAMQMHGDQAWNDTLASVKSADRELYEGVLLLSGWYPIGSYNRVLRWFMQSNAMDTELEMRRYAEFVADKDLHSIFKTLLKAATPEMILRRSPSLWSRYFSVGTLRVQKELPKDFLLVLEAPTDEDQGPGPLTCGGGVCGWMELALRLSGALSPKVSEQNCRFRGHTHCEYRARWG